MLERLDEHKDQILGWIKDKKSITFIFTQLKCSRDGLKSWLSRNNIVYGGNQGRKGCVNRKADDIFAIDTHYAPSSFLKWILDYKLLEYRCDCCGIHKWNSKNIRLEVDHINGMRSDNRKENLRLLCPNCHSQTHTFRGRNIKKSQRKVVSDLDLISALAESPNIYNALIRVGLAPKGANYTRAKNLLKDMKSS